MVAAEYRYVDEAVWVGEGGFLLSGHKGIASFALDARTFNETVEGRNWTSYDGDAVDYQDAGVTGSASYLSYSRYRGNLALDLPFGRLEVGRDAAQWSAPMGNLVFNAAAVPFNQFAFTTHIGPVSVRSLYGDIHATGAGGILGGECALRPSLRVAAGAERPLGDLGAIDPLWRGQALPFYAHLSSLHGQVLLTRGQQQRQPGLRRRVALARPSPRLRGVLLDDIKSPSSLLFKDYAQNKWGALAGLHAPFSVGGHPGGAVFEAVRIEPWVYTHFRDFPAPAANADLPLGDPGLNVLDLRARIYLRGPDREGVTGMLPGSDRYLGLTTALTWEGDGPRIGRGRYHLRPRRLPEAEGVLARRRLFGVFRRALRRRARGPFRLEGAWTLATRPTGYSNT